MPSRYPRDRFDDLPKRVDRVGAHRAPGRRGRAWIGFVWAAAATLVLVGFGVAGLFALNNRLDFPGISLPAATTAETSTPTPTPTVVPTAEPTVDPSLSVTVLNGTPGAGVARGVGEILTAAGWMVVTTSNADTEDVPTTTVYYADPALEGAARGVAQSIPGSSVLLAPDFAETGAQLTVVVGNDYLTPAG